MSKAVEQEALNLIQKLNDKQKFDIEKIEHKLDNLYKTLIGPIDDWK